MKNNQFHHLALKVKTEQLNVHYLPPSICESGSIFLSGSIFFGYYVQVANMYKRKNCEFNENVYSVHTQLH